MLWGDRGGRPARSASAPSCDVLDGTHGTMLWSVPTSQGPSPAPRSPYSSGPLGLNPLNGVIVTVLSVKKACCVGLGGTGSIFIRNYGRSPFTLSKPVNSPNKEKGGGLPRAWTCRGCSASPGSWFKTPRGTCHTFLILPYRHKHSPVSGG